MIGTRMKVKMNPVKVRAAKNRARHESIQKSVGWIRAIASRSIGRSKDPSLPGKPPHTRAGKLKRGIRFAIEKEGRITFGGIIGPTATSLLALMHKHEFGGSVRTKPRKFLMGKHKVGGPGPIRVKPTGKLQYIVLRTAADVQRADRLALSENMERDEFNQRIAGKIAHYPKRPFMRPALMRAVNRNEIPKFWAGSFKR